MWTVLTFAFVTVPRWCREWQWRRLNGRMPAPVSGAWLRERKQQRALQASVDR